MKRIPFYLCVVVNLIVSMAVVSSLVYLATPHIYKIMAGDIEGIGGIYISLFMIFLSLASACVWNWHFLFTKLRKIN